MKTLTGSRAFFFASLCLTVLPRSARAAIVWTATHESGNLSEWMSGPNPTKTLPGGVVRKNVEVLGEQVYSGKYACKITVPGRHVRSVQPRPGRHPARAHADRRG